MVNLSVSSLLADVVWLPDVIVPCDVDQLLYSAPAVVSGGELVVDVLSEDASVEYCSLVNGSVVVTSVALDLVSAHCIQNEKH